MPCHITPCHAMPCHATQWPCLVMSCHVMSCHIIPHIISGLTHSKMSNKAYIQQFAYICYGKTILIHIYSDFFRKLTKTLNSSCLENLYISICKTFSKMYLLLQSYKNRTKATCPLKYSFLKCLIDVNIFLLLFPKTTFDNLIAYVAIKILYHAKMWVYEI